MDGPSETEVRPRGHGAGEWKGREGNGREWNGMEWNGREGSGLRGVKSEMVGRHNSPFLEESGGGCGCVRGGVFYKVGYNT